MKKLLLLSFIVLTSVSFGRRGLGQIEPYTVLSDSFASAVPVGFCLVKGVAYNYNVGVPNGKISTLDGKYQTTTDSSGAYKLLIPEKDTAIFFFKSQYNEVVVWNYDFKSQHVVTLNFYSDANNQMIISAKPVIYLYSEKDLKVSLDLNYHGELTFTYPLLESGWEVNVNKNGIEYNEKHFPYLFWEGKSKDLSLNINKDKSVDGAVIDKENIVDYLEESLSTLGFNHKEKTDFITFWAPRMIKSNYCLVQFVLDEDYESQIANLDVVPKPDASRRVYMYFSGFDVLPNIEVQPQSFEGFQRIGFTLLEWGGTEIDFNLKSL